MKKSSMRNYLLWMGALALAAVSACNYTVGDCWPRGQGSDNGAVGAGAGGPIIPGGVGGYGDQLQESPTGGLKCNSDDGETQSTKDPCSGDSYKGRDGAAFIGCTDACSSKCGPSRGITVADFGLSDFPFATTVPDDGTDKGGGYQEAKVNLEFQYILIPLKARIWYCPFTIQMPLRTEVWGKISSTRAASISKEVTEGVASGMDFTLSQGVFCIQFIDKVNKAFDDKYKKLGAKAVKK